MLADVSGLPVNGDLEDGFGPEPEDCVRTVHAAIEGRLAGLGIEDSTADVARPLHAFDAAIETFAIAYADQTERDYELLVKAIRAGRLPAQRNVA